jgi:hypothetical protein
MKRGPIEAENVTAAVKWYRKLHFIKPSVAAVARHFKIKDRSTLAKALKRKDKKNGK